MHACVCVCVCGVSGREGAFLRGMGGAPPNNNKTEFVTTGGQRPNTKTVPCWIFTDFFH